MQSPTPRFANLTPMLLNEVASPSSLPHAQVLDPPRWHDILHASSAEAVAVAPQSGLLPAEGEQLPVAHVLEPIRNAPAVQPTGTTGGCAVDKVLVCKTSLGLAAEYAPSTAPVLASVPEPFGGVHNTPSMPPQGAHLYTPSAQTAPKEREAGAAVGVSKLHAPVQRGRGGRVLSRGRGGRGGRGARSLPASQTSDPPAMQVCIHASPGGRGGRGQMRISGQA
uniref:Uncharacterized protein n=1 Tax=Coccolithus braarudii TaxID=221442 RepID=A0A7S0LTI0_9EUKA